MVFFGSNEFVEPCSLAKSRYWDKGRTKDGGPRKDRTEDKSWTQEREPEFRVPDRGFVNLSALVLVCQIIQRSRMQNL
jgi:hypothetical protein